MKSSVNGRAGFLKFCCHLSGTKAGARARFFFAGFLPGLAFFAPPRFRVALASGGGSVRGASGYSRGQPSAFESRPSAQQLGRAAIHTYAVLDVRDSFGVVWRAHHTRACSFAMQNCSPRALWPNV